jgi:hypothetical protein
MMAAAGGNQNERIGVPEVLLSKVRRAHRVSLSWPWAHDRLSSLRPKDNSLQACSYGIRHGTGFSGGCATTYKIPALTPCCSPADCAVAGAPDSKTDPAATHCSVGRGKAACLRGVRDRRGCLATSDANGPAHRGITENTNRTASAQTECSSIARTSLRGCRPSKKRTKPYQGGSSGHRCHPHSWRRSCGVFALA